MGKKGVVIEMKMAEIIPDIIPEERRPMDPPTGIFDDDDFEDEDFDEDDFE